MTGIMLKKALPGSCDLGLALLLCGHDGHLSSVFIDKKGGYGIKYVGFPL